MSENAYRYTSHTRAAYGISARYNVVCRFLSINGMLFEGEKYHSGHWGLVVVR